MQFNLAIIRIFLAASSALFTTAAPVAASSPQDLTAPQPAQNLTAIPSVPAAQPPAVQPPNLLSIQTAELAGGGVPAGGPTSFSPNAIVNFKIANFLEGVESAFFAQSLIILGKDPAFTTPGADGKSIQNITSQIAAQELVHKATLEGLILTAKEQPVPACTTILPVSDVPDFLAKANLVTSTAIGVIVTILQSLAGSMDAGLLGPLSSILSVESKQDAFFRMASANTPSSSPIDTAISPAWAVHLALDLVDPLSCPQLPAVDMLPKMTVTNPVFGSTPPSVMPPEMTFTFERTRVMDGVPLFVGWVNQANAPVYTPITVGADGTSGSTPIPAGLTGIAFAALTNQSSAMTTAQLTDATIAGPAGVLFS